MSKQPGPLLTREVAGSLLAARDVGTRTWTGSLDLARSVTNATLEPHEWQWQGRGYPYPPRLKDRTVYYWDGEDFAAVSRFSGSLIKLVPTEWGAPTFEIDGIKMLPTARESPLDDARRKVALVQPRGKRVLDTCGGLGYFAACCLEAGAARIDSFEKNADVLWLRELNPWSPVPDGFCSADAFAANAADVEKAATAYSAANLANPANVANVANAASAPASQGRYWLFHADVSKTIAQIGDASVDAVLHDPPRFGIAGELYSQAFYAELARVLRRGGRLFHYTGSPNKLTSGRDVPREVRKRLEAVGFKAQLALDGVLATR